MSNFQTTHEKVKLKVQYNKRLLDITFDEQSEVAQIPHTEFLLIFRARTTAPPTETPVTIIVTHGSDTVRIPITIAILPPGREPSRGPGIRPPVEPATGSEEGGYCVWRSKSFIDGPNCFNIDRAPCDTPRFSGNSKYELVGSSMTPIESAALASRLSPYKGDAYGCHKRPSDPQGTSEGQGGQDSGSGTGSSGGTETGGGQGTGEGTGKGTGEDEKTGESDGTNEDEGTGEEEECSGEESPCPERESTGENEGEDADLLSEFPTDPEDDSTTDETVTSEQVASR